MQCSGLLVCHLASLSLEISIQLFFFPFLFPSFYCWSVCSYVINAITGRCNWNFLTLFNIGLEPSYRGNNAIMMMMISRSSSVVVVLVVKRAKYMTWARDIHSASTIAGTPNGDWIHCSHIDLLRLLQNMVLTFFVNIKLNFVWHKIWDESGPLSENRTHFSINGNLDCFVNYDLMAICTIVSVMISIKLAISLLTS